MSLAENARAGRWLHCYAILVALATLSLIAIGGLVTSRGVGMAVPDWPTTAGYNMFAFPISRWVGGIFYEHTHRLVASVVGLLVVCLTRWLGGNRSRLPLAIVGAAEVVSGIGLLQFGQKWHGAGYFLSGIGGVVLFAGLVWVRNTPAAKPLPLLGWLAFGAVQLQGLLGGLRVVLYNDQIGIFHAALAQCFFVLLCAIAVLTSRWWKERLSLDASYPQDDPPTLDRDGCMQDASGYARLHRWVAAATLLIFAQLLLGATMRHQHAGLAIPDFPLAYGKIWPRMDAASIQSYNSRRIEITDPNPITTVQIVLQMTHRMVALFVLCAVAACSWLASRRDFAPARWLQSRLALAWLGLVLFQLLLGAATIWTDKAADVATAHVVVGTLSLALGAMFWMVCSESREAGSKLQFASCRLDSPPQSNLQPATCNL